MEHQVETSSLQRAESSQALSKERIMSALRQSPGGFNSARNQPANAPRGNGPETFGATLRSAQSGFERQGSGSLPPREAIFLNQT